MENNRTLFLQGMRDGVPIMLGYLAVSFSLGIPAAKAGLSPFQGFLASFLCNASAGEYAGFTMIAAQASYLEMALATLIANARYFLMSCAMSQKIDPQLPNAHRYLFGAGVTDEIFAITIARPGRLEPMYNYGAMAVSVPAWAVGTALGIIMGNLLPARAVSALSVALYGMFLAIIIPPMKKSLAIALCVIAGFASSWAAGAYLPLSAGTRTIVLTVGLSSLAALLFPREEESGDA
jgi:predicted branched-subunit amino acid permease